MKVIGINGSPRKNGNTRILIETVFSKLEKKEIETELIQLGGKPIHGCIACGKCREKLDKQCHINSSFINQIIEKMIEADGIIIGSPVYFADVTTEIKALIDVAGYVTRGNGHLLKQKVGAAIAVARRAGSMHTLESIHNFFLINQMIIPGSTYWTLAYGKNKGDVKNDTEGIKTMQTLGDNMAWLIKKLQ